MTARARRRPRLTRGARSAASCCARDACRRRSSARSTTLMPRYGIAYAPAPDRFRARLRPRRAPWCSRSVSAWARRRPRSRERTRPSTSSASRCMRPGVGSLLRRIDELGAYQRARDPARCGRVVATMIAPGSLAGIHVFFPDPWPKKRHHKRRLLKPRVRARAGAAARAGRLSACRDRLGRVRARDTRRLLSPSRCS